MIFRISAFDAEALKVWRDLLEWAKAPILDADLWLLYYYGKVKGFFTGDKAVASRGSWNRFGDYLIRALATTHNAGIAELALLWRECDIARREYKSSGAPVGACVAPGAMPIPPVPVPRRRRTWGDEGSMTRPAPLSEAGARESPCGIATVYPSLEWRTWS
ncbi:hypothetical protein HGM15179_021907 [Zosterops borbonicus]|uniref:Uncharacterized protein n=1 Tax=Zosterops borbonicus TaxID=364589 RepID=A0A8K1FWT2_9PASS|nr:hypothetical protein HGM15179_021907 [Zosterops borbonicus]